MPSEDYFDLLDKSYQGSPSLHIIECAGRFSTRESLVRRWGFGRHLGGYRFRRKDDKEPGG